MVSVASILHPDSKEGLLKSTTGPDMFSIEEAVYLIHFNPLTFFQQAKEAVLLGFSRRS